MSARRPAKVFATADFARATGIDEARALEFLQHFQAVGVVERRLRSGWVATPRGLRLSRELGLVSPPRARRAA